MARHARATRQRTQRLRRAAGKSTRRWSQHVTQTSNALALEEGVFTLESPEAIARSLKRSAEESQRRKSPPFQSAMSMLNFYENRAGRNLPASRKKVLEQAKVELRRLYGRTLRSPSSARAPPPA